MADRQAQNYLSSGEISEIKIGGTTDNSKVVVKSELEHVVLIPAYCGYMTSPMLNLTNAYQKVIGWTEQVEPQGISHLNGTFTATISGIYKWDLERIYINHDTNPSTPPIIVYIEAIKNDSIVAFMRDMQVATATANDEPSTIARTSPFIFRVEAGDTFYFQVKALDGTANPEDMELALMQMTAHKIFN